MPVVRVLHTADLHLDASFATEGLPPEIGRQCRLTQRDTLRALLDRAVSWPADAVLIAGDLFEATRLSRDTLSFLQDAFASIAPLPIFIAPGKADPFVPNAPYALETWPANVTIFRQGQWERHDLQKIPLSVHGFACTGDTPSRNPFVDFQVPREESAQIGLVYAAEQSRVPMEHTVQTIFNHTDVKHCGLDYLALGYAHEQATLQNEGNTRACYPGAPHGLGFTTASSGQYLEIELEPGTSPTVRPIAINSLLLKEASLEVDHCKNFKELMDSLEPILASMENAAMTLLRLTLHGEAAWLLPATLPVLRERLRERLNWLELIDHVDTESWYQANTDAQTSAGAFMQRMAREIQDAPDPETREKLMRARALGMTAFRGESMPYETSGGKVV